VGDATLCDTGAQPLIGPFFVAVEPNTPTIGLLILKIDESGW
jgi:hypothetical protein